MGLSTTIIMYARSIQYICKADMLNPSRLGCRKFESKTEQTWTFFQLAVSMLGVSCPQQ